MLKIYFENSFFSQIMIGLFGKQIKVLSLTYISTANAIQRLCSGVVSLTSFYIRLFQFKAFYDLVSLAVQNSTHFYPIQNSLKLSLKD